MTRIGSEFPLPAYPGCNILNFLYHSTFKLGNPEQEFISSNSSRFNMFRSKTSWKLWMIFWWQGSQTGGSLCDKYVNNRKWMWSPSPHVYLKCQNFDYCLWAVKLFYPLNVRVQGLGLQSCCIKNQIKSKKMKSKSIANIMNMMNIWFIFAFRISFILIYYFLRFHKH